MQLYRYLFILFLIIQTPVVAMADAIGTWRLYNCYSDIQQIQPAGDDVFVLASGNLYSYNTKENSLTTYDKTTCLNSNDITRIAWVQQAKRLVIAYSNHSIDFLSLNQDVVNINDLADKQMAGDKTINDIYVSGKYAYLSTGFGIVKINVADAYIVDTYNLGCKVDYCYIEGSTIYAASSTNGLLSAALSANLLDKNVWSRVGDYTPKTIEAYTYDAHNNCYWGANADSQLTKYKKQDDGEYQAVTTGVKPNGPSYPEHNYLRYDNGRLISLRGLYEYVVGDTSTPGFVQEYSTDTDAWSVYSNMYSESVGKNCIAHTRFDIDPRDRNHVMVASKSGLYEYRNGSLVSYHDMNTDDPIVSVINVPDYSVVTGLKYDSHGNLWLFNMGNKNVICLTSGNEWRIFPNDKLSTDGTRRIKSCYFDSRGLLWFVNDHWDYSMCGFYDVANDEIHAITNFVNEDGTKVSVGNAFTVTEDKNNNIWIGSTGGCFYLSADDVTTMRSSSADNAVRITQHKVPRNDGTNYADYLLDGVLTYDIKVDAANRKWFATDRGVYLVSSDCNTQLEHFTTDNSPLPTNEVKSISVNDVTGEVFFGTLKGLCSYKSDIYDGYNGELSEGNVYAYPNPVTPEHRGDITVAGLTDGAQVHILTSSGSLVKKGTCHGGTFKWDGTDLNGQRVASGVYMVNVATPEGEKGITTKIAIIR